MRSHKIRGSGDENGLKQRRVGSGVAIRSEALVTRMGGVMVTKLILRKCNLNNFKLDKKEKCWVKSYSRSLSTGLFYYILCVDISVIKPRLRMIPVK